MGASAGKNLVVTCSTLPGLVSLVCPAPSSSRRFTSCLGEKLLIDKGLIIKAEFMSGYPQLGQGIRRCCERWAKCAGVDMHCIVDQEPGSHAHLDSYIEDVSTKDLIRQLRNRRKCPWKRQWWLSMRSPSRRTYRVQRRLYEIAFPKAILPSRVRSPSKR